MAKRTSGNVGDRRSANTLPALIGVLIMVELLGVLFTMSDGIWFTVVAPILIFNVGPILCLIIFVRYVL